MKEVSFFTKTFLVLFTAILGLLAQYSCNIFLAKNLGAQQYGDYSVVYSSIMILSTLILLGFDKHVVKQLPYHVDKGEIGIIKQYTRQAQVSFLVAATVVSLIAWFVLVVFVNEQHYLITFSIIGAFIFSLVFFSSKILIAYKRPIQAMVPYRLGIPIIVIITTYFFQFYLHFLNAMVAISIYLITLITVLGWYYFFLLRNIIPKYADQKNIKIDRLWFMAAMKYLPLSLSVIFIANIGVASIKVMHFSDKNVAYYAAIVHTGDILVAIKTAINGLILPLISPCFHEQKLSFCKVKPKVNLYLLINYLLVILFIGLFYFFGVDVLSLFGKGFSSAHLALMMQVIGESINVAFGLSIVLLQYKGKENIVSAFLMLQMAVVLVLDFVLVPDHGVTGAACAYMLSYVIIMPFFIHLCYKETKLKMLPIN